MCYEVSQHKQGPSGRREYAKLFHTGPAQPYPAKAGVCVCVHGGRESAGL